MLCSAQQEKQEKGWAMSVPSGFSSLAKIPEIDTSAPGVGRRWRPPSRRSPLEQERSGSRQWRIQRRGGLRQRRAREGFGGAGLDAPPPPARTKTMSTGTGRGGEVGNPCWRGRQICADAALPGRRPHVARVEHDEPAPGRAR
jgi:hypothetical protein